jgi:hypothetical protein
LRVEGRTYAGVDEYSAGNILINPGTAGPVLDRSERIAYQEIKSPLPV